MFSHTIFITRVVSTVIPIVVTLVRKVSNSLAIMLNVSGCTQRGIQDNFRRNETCHLSFRFNDNCASQSVCFSNMYGN